MKRSVLSLACLGGMILAQGASAASDQILPYMSRKLKYPQLVSWDAPMQTLWAGWKSRFVVGGQVQGNDPSGNKSVVSEGQAYGMMMALWLNDQATFNSIWSATEAAMWNGTSYGWKASDKTSWAADADLDIAGMLIFASALVDSGYWTDYSVGANNYKAKAKINLAGIASNMISGGMIKSGNWTGAMNPSYQEVHWYRVFAEFLAKNGGTDPGWATTVYNGGYQLLAAQPSGNKGMARNFSTTTGASQGDGNSMPTRDDMGFDACRVPFRVGLDLLWYHSAKGAIWAKGAWKGGIVTAERPGMYNNLSGSPTLWGWCDVADINSGACTPQYEGFMTRAMWGASALGLYDSTSVPEAKAAFVAIAQNISGIINTRNYLSYYEDNATSTPSKNYFAQSLGLLGAIAISGRAVNVWDDLKNPWIVPDTAAQITTALKSSNAAIYLTGAGKPDSTVFSATLSKPAVCTLMLVGATSGAKYRSILSGVSAVSVKWTPSMIQSFTTVKFVGGETVNAELRISGKPLPVAANAKASVAINPAVGVAARPVTATRAQWLGSELVLPQGALRGASSATVRVLDLRGHVVAQGQSSVLADERSTRLTMTRPSGISGLFTLEVLADGEAFRASLAAF